MFSGRGGADGWVWRQDKKRKDDKKMEGTEASRCKGMGIPAHIFRKKHVQRLMVSLRTRRISSPKGQCPVSPVPFVG